MRHELNVRNILEDLHYNFVTLLHLLSGEPRAACKGAAPEHL